jgi:hypothetical protein
MYISASFLPFFVPSSQRPRETHCRRHVVLVFIAVAMESRDEKGQGGRHRELLALEGWGAAERFNAKMQS